MFHLRFTNVVLVKEILITPSDINLDGPSLNIYLQAGWGWLRIRSRAGHFQTRKILWFGCQPLQSVCVEDTEHRVAPDAAPSVCGCVWMIYDLCVWKSQCCHIVWCFEASSRLEKSSFKCEIIYHSWWPDQKTSMSRFFLFSSLVGQFWSWFLCRWPTEAQTTVYKTQQKRGDVTAVGWNYGFIMHFWKTAMTG